MLVDIVNPGWTPVYLSNLTSAYDVVQKGMSSVLDGHVLYDKQPVLHMLRTDRYPVEV